MKNMFHNYVKTSRFYLFSYSFFYCLGVATFKDGMIRFMTNITDYLLRKNIHFNVIVKIEMCFYYTLKDNIKIDLSEVLRMLGGCN